MRNLTTAQIQALASGNVMRRMFIWCDALDLYGNPDPAGFWDDVGTIEHDGRVYHGSGTVISIETLSAGSDFTIPRLKITASGLELSTNELVRTRKLAQRPISVSIGLFAPATHAVIPPLIPYFEGVVDDPDIPTAAGGKSQIVLTCESASRALTIKRTETRSKSSLSQRTTGDRFYDYAAGQREKTIYFGRKGP
ncbi:hypothetical protein RA307_31855 [Xanthobacteraceae bacterium Astr-EGSB]|uniref:hypothetical protein n=1 Tax=Astrobacterium formosum TaxID=3069710 RepID=UPI0027B8653F|nr:hypothetical protein [Xanthobacteraceae bacterium Astr-EGSB]